MIYPPIVVGRRSLIQPIQVEGEGRAVTFEHTSRITTVRIYREQIFAGGTAIIISLPWELDEAAMSLSREARRVFFSSFKSWIDWA